MTEDDFRRIALGMAGAIESAHMGHPDFRSSGRIFATLHHDRLTGMVALTPEQQERFVREHPAAFLLESGAWGRGGSTRVRLDRVDEDTLGEAMTLAWQNAGAKAAARAARPKPARKSTAPKTSTPAKKSPLAKKQTPAKRSARPSKARSTRGT